MMCDDDSDSSIEDHYMHDKSASGFYAQNNLFV